MIRPNNLAFLAYMLISTLITINQAHAADDAPVGQHATIEATFKMADGQLVKKEFTTSVPEKGLEDVDLSEPRMAQTFAVISLANAMKEAIKARDADSKIAAADLRERAEEISSWIERSGIARSWPSFPRFKELVDQANKLAKNIEVPPLSFGHWGRGSWSGSSYLESACACSAPSSFNVSSGGAQSAAKAWDTIKNGEVPSLEDFNIGGLLKEFDLSLEDLACPEGEICFGSGIAIDRIRGKLYVQMNMAVKPTDEQMQRKPWNISILVDISGSMTGARMQWAEKALEQILRKHLQPGDFVSIHQFDDKVETVLATTELTSLMIKPYKFATRGATNLELALRTGFASVKRSQIELGIRQNDYQSAVILISDAQANTGETSGDALKVLVQEAAMDNIGLIAIGIGSANGWDTGFHQGLIDVITKTKGGSYDFASSEEDMDRAIKKLPYLINPFAYGLKALVRLEGAKLFRIYGTAADENSVPDSAEVISIPTMVLTPAEDGGGATILEYDIPKSASMKNPCDGSYCSMAFRVLGDDGEQRFFEENQNVTIPSLMGGMPISLKIIDFSKKGLILEECKSGDARTLLVKNPDHIKTLRSIRRADTGKRRAQSPLVIHGRGPQTRSLR